MKLFRLAIERAARATATAIALAISLGIAVPAAAQMTEDIRYTVKPGDTLSVLSRELLDGPERWPEVQRYNNVGNVRRLPIGMVLRLRPEWLRPQAITGRFESVGGRITANGVQAADGAAVGEGALVDSGDDGTAVIVLGDGTRLRIPPASRVRIERLRQYHSDGAIEALLRLDRGSIEPNSPGRKRPLDIRTPAGNAAVRGTEYRVRVGDRGDFIEVLSGVVDVGSGAGRADVTGGNGAVISASAAPRLEPLLPAPDMQPVAGRRFAEASPTLTLPTVDQAVAYRVEVAGDPAFVDMLLSTRVSRPVVTLASRRDGPYYVRLRGISAAGLDGQEAVARVDIQARPFAPRTLAPAATDELLAGAVPLRWAASPGLRYRVQIGADERFERILDEAVVDGDSATLTLPAGPAGPRWWRVAAIEPPASDAGTPRQGPFSAPQTFTMIVPAPVVRPEPVPILRDGSGEPIRSGGGGIVSPGF